ncbi:sulfotransferase domain-containing protein [Microbulbifer aggregans]|uniref:sulfotransferase domain-containing protein n=1 Tax=Microbulbifer aggregans TaxID=1769779 RepID=UPI001CFE6F30|nr:sulfotransferase domain-containing protein [Microbulbifer aggregans]
MKAEKKSYSLEEIKKPSFLIVGAMKCATTTLYDQLRLQNGVFMPDLKEPNFFSDDAQYYKGFDWYEDLFCNSSANEIIGEASTHYTKLPTYPDTISRIKDYLGKPKIIYVMRNPIDRMVSQYVHEWSCGNINVPIDDAIDLHPELINYSLFHYQLKPYLDALGHERVLPVFFERLKREPQVELERIAKFIGLDQRVEWKSDLPAKNISSERIRNFPLYGLLVKNKAMEVLRRSLVPKKFRSMVKKKFQMKARPELSKDSESKIKNLFNSDLEKLGVELGVELDLENYKETVSSRTLNWADEEFTENKENVFANGL